MAWYSSRTGAVITALVIVVCASPATQAQEWVLWRNTPSLRDQDPAKRLPPPQRADTPAPEQTQRRAVAAPVAIAAQPSRAAAPAIDSAVAAPRPVAIAVSTQVATPAPGTAAAYPGSAPTPMSKRVSSANAVPPAPTAGAAQPSATTMTTSAADLRPATSSASAATSATTASSVVPTTATAAALARPAPLPSVSVPALKRGAAAITMPAHSTADTEAVAIVPLDDGVGPIAAPAASGGVIAAANATLARAEPVPVPAPPRATGAYVTVGSDSDASVVAAAPQVYSCDESGRCEHLENERPNVGLQAAPAIEDSSHRQIESEIKRSALRGF